MIKIERINKISVKPVIANGGEPSPFKIKGYDYIPMLYANIFLCAKKKSGKTNVIYNLLKHVTTTKTKVYIFSSTINKDSTYDAIESMLEKRKVFFESFTHFVDANTGENIIDEILATSDNEEEEQVKKPTTSKIERGPLFAPKESEEEKSKPKKEAPDYVFVFDDLGQDLRHPSINQLLKTNRHHKAKVILSSQYINDLQPQAIKQLDYALLFKSFNEEKLKDIYNLLDLSLPFEHFQQLYHFATKEPYSFMYVDVRNEKFRKNFSTGLRYDT